MGHVTEAHCNSCGYSRSVSIGGTRSSFQEYSTWPVYCTSCRDMTSTNTRVEPLTCLQCQSTEVTKYDAHNLVQGGSDQVSQWGSDNLTNGKYFCPKCKKNELRFSSMPSMFFD